MSMSTDDHGRERDGDLVDEVVRRSLGGDAPPELHARVGRRFDAFRQAPCESPAAPKRRARRTGLRLAIAGGLAASAAAALVVLALGRPGLTWALVVEQFKSVRFLNATIVVTEDAVAAPERIELWAGRGGVARVHHAGRVLFGRSGEVVGAFDVTSGSAIDVGALSPQELRERRLAIPVQMIRMLGGMDEFSLEAVIETFSGTKTRSPPLPNGEASIAEDMVVFDVTSTASPEWARIWVLRESGLPARVRVWDPRDGESTDVAFEYIREQPADAFDPDAFAREMRSAKGSANRLYRLLRDPGERPLSPERLVEETGYHMPEIREVGRTDDGVVWVKSARSRNRRPDGPPFEGFGILEDDLGQEYERVQIGHQVRGDLCLEYFVPLTYGERYRRPSRLKLTCWSQPVVSHEDFVVVGSTEVREWRDGAPVPDTFGFGNTPGVREFRRTLLRALWRRRAWERVDRVLDEIPGEPETDAEAFERDVRRLSRLKQLERIEEARALAARLHAIVAPGLEKPWDPERGRFHGWYYAHAPIYSVHIAALLEEGRRDEAADILGRIATRLRDTEGAEHAIEDLFGFLAGRLQLTDGEIDVLVGFELPVEESVRARYRRPGSPDLEDPRYGAWRAYVDRLAARYRERPLPEEVEVLSEAEGFPTGRESASMTLPGHGGYRVFVADGSWHGFLTSTALHREWDTALVSVAEDLASERVRVTCVVRDGTDWVRIFDEIVRVRELEVVTSSTPRTVWVGRWDGRDLPNYRLVPRIDAGEAGRARYGSSNWYITAAALLDGFERALNPDGGDPADFIPVIDETGLPSEPGPDQLWSDVCLVYGYEFWSGDEAIERTREWFHDNFGITFSEETREIEVRELRRVAKR